MNLKLKPILSLVYYDLPEVFIAEDQINTSYVCTLISEVDQILTYLVVSISKQRLSELLKNKIDLRDTYLSNETDSIFYFQSTNLKDWKFIDTKSAGEVPESHLPLPDFYPSHFIDIDDVLLADLITNRNAVLHLGIDDRNTDHSVSANELSQILFQFQKVIKYSYKKMLVTLKQAVRKELDNESNYNLRVFATSPGSLNIRMKSDSDSNLFERSEITRAFEKLDEIINTDADDDFMLKCLHANRGHLISNYKAFLKTIIDSDLTIKYRWISPDMTSSSGRNLNKEYAQRIYGIIEQKQELSEEERIFSGQVVLADVDNYKWRLKNSETGEEISGHSQISLSGIVLDDSYEFRCIEKVEVVDVSEKEITSYELTKYKKI